MRRGRSGTSDLSAAVEQRYPLVFWRKFYDLSLLHGGAGRFSKLNAAMRRLIPLFALGSVAASVAAAGDAPTLEITRFSVGQSHYLESCGGCHGLLGVSSNQHVPPLKDVVGTFLCTP